MAVCNAGDGSLTPFIAKYCTTLGFDMDMARTMSGQELICAMSEKLNEVICFDNATRELQNQLEADTDAWEKDFREEFDTNLQNSVNQAIGEQVNNGTLKAPGIIVCFGDSFGNDNYEWPNLLASNLGYTADNYCVSGASWPFDSQLNECIAKYDTSEKKANIAFGIAYGGINNVASGGVLTSTKIYTDFISKFNANFPGVKLYICPMNNGNSKYTEPNYPNAYVNAFKSALYAYKWLPSQSGDFILLPHSDKYAYGVQGAYREDNLHPNSVGEIAIAHRMASAIKGTFSMTAMAENLTEVANITFNNDGYITAEGFQTPEMVVEATTGTNAAFRANGFCVYNRQPLFYITYSDETTASGFYMDGKVYAISDPNNDQFSIVVGNFPTVHHLVIPSQFIPWGYIDRSN